MDYLAPALLPVYAASILMMLLAAALLFWGGRRGAALWFAAYLVMDSLSLSGNAVRNALALQDLGTMSAAEIDGTLRLLNGLTRAVMALLPSNLFLIVVAAHVLSDQVPRWLARVALFAVVGLAILNTVVPPQVYVIADGAFVSPARWHYLVVLEAPAFASIGAALLVLTHRAVGEPGSSARQSQALLGLALLIYPLHRGAVYVVGAFTHPEAVVGEHGQAAVEQYGSLAIAVFLLFCSYVAIRRLARFSPRRLALVGGVVIGLGSGIARALFPQVPDYVFFGIAYVPLPLIATYALLRNNLFGLDVKVRFAISKSTLAAIFIAVFFIASEAAQQFFGDRFSNQQYGAYMGIAAAGGLVFAFAPMQRLADRIAEKAVPVAPAAVPAAAWNAAAASASNDDLYRRALRIALADRRLTADEDLTLAELSERLGLGARRALELRHEVALEVAQGPRAGARGKRKVGAR